MLLALASFRHQSRHPWQLALSLLGIALGVAVVVAVDIASGSAREAFTQATRSVQGRATHAVVGGPDGLDEQVYVRLRRAGVRASAPLVEAEVVVRGEPSRRLTLLGVDPLAEQQFRAWRDTDPARGEDTPSRWLASLVTHPEGVLLAAPLAAELGLAVGDRLPLLVRGRERDAEVVGLLAAADDLQATALRTLLVADISVAQRLLGRPGRLDRIDLRVPDGVAGERLLARVRTLLPADASLTDQRERGAARAAMTRAFDLNLLMLGLLALLVGSFLIYNTMTFSVLQRRALFGVLRALGCTRGAILALVLGEALVLGLLAAVLGAGLGVLLAEGLTGLVARTVNDLYFHVEVTRLAVDASTFLKATVLGVGAALGAALLPALEATRVPAGVALRRSVLEGRVRAAVPGSALAGLALMLVSLGLLVWPGGSLALGFVALFGLVAGFALQAPLVARVGSRWLTPAAGWLAGTAGRHAVRGVGAGASRSAVAIAALSVAVAATIGVAVMVESFRDSVERWLQTTLRADLYVGMPGPAEGRVLDEVLVQRVRDLPGVREVSEGRHVSVESPLGPLQLLVLHPARGSYAGFDLIEGEASRVWPAFDREDVVLASEPFAYRHALAPGGEVELRTDAGLRRFRVVAVYRDYGSEQGVLLMSRATFERHWRARGAATLGVYLATEADAAQVAQQLRAMAPAGESLQVRSNRAIRTASLAVFDRTFTITRVLRWLATLVAFVGVLSALMALALEREREVAVLRAQGMTAGEVWWLVELQTGAIGLLAGLLALPLGLALAAALIDVVNRRAFGWTMQTSIDPGALLVAVLLAIGASLLAGIYPAWRMSRIPPAVALREE